MARESQIESERQENVFCELIQPETAIDIGYNLYLCDMCTDPALAKSAKSAINQFNKIAATAGETSPEGMYYVKLRMAANSLARGISRRKQTLRDKLQAAHQRKEDMVRRISQTEHFVGILRGGFQLLLLGGMTYAITTAVFGMTGLELESTGMQAKSAAIASALGIALIGSFMNARFMARRILQIFAQYDAAVTTAQKAYARSVIKEYRLAVETANQAWRELTGSDPPATPGLENLLIGVMGGDQFEQPQEKVQSHGGFKTWFQIRRQELGRAAEKMIDKVKERR